MSTDFDLLDQWRAGDKAAGSDLFNRHFAAIRRFFRNKATPEDVEDLIQRTFLACVESRDRFRGDSSFRTYLFVVARNELYRYLRKRARDHVRDGLDFTASSICDIGVSPSGVIAKQEEHKLVVAALQRIPVDQQVLLELYYWEQVPGPELAEVFDVNPTTIRTRLFRAREALKQEMEQLTGGGVEIDLEESVRGLSEKN